MIKLVIFGTGSSGQRAWQAAGGIEGVSVEAFVDNDARKHGQRMHDRPVIAPSELPGMTWDFVVLASQWAADIAAQLTGLGIAPERILRPALNAMRGDLERALAEARECKEVEVEGGRRIKAGDLPRVLVVTYETLNESHGTGVMLLRYFRDFPRKHLFSVCHLAAGKPALAQAALFEGRESHTSAHVATELRKHGFVPDIVYVTAFNENDLTLLAAVLEAVPAGTPVIQHFMDYMPHDAAAFDAQFRVLLPRISQVWALTSTLQEELAQKLGCEVGHVSCLQQSVSAEFKTEHAEYRDGFRTVLLGNPWQPWTIPFLADVWSRCRRALPGLLPIEWYCHPLRAQALIDGGYDPGFEVIWRGFVPDLQQRLRTADLAVMPFNIETQVSNHYARGSVPSRITELASAGLPIVALASPDSGLAQLVGSRKIGISCAGPDAAAVADSVIRFIRDREGRAAAGHASRALAEREFRLEPFQAWLVGRLLELTGGRREQAFVPEASSIVPLAGTENVPRNDWRTLICDRIHYACGRNVLHGWFNVDGFDESYPHGAIPSDYVERIFRMDLTREHPFPDESFRLAYSEDFLEHLDQADAITFLAEAFRTLKKGGVLRLSFPGLTGVLRRHLSGSGYLAGARCREDAYTRWWHKHFFSFEEIREVALAIGYSVVRRCDYGAGTIPELIQETRPDQTDLNLVVELVR